eukprot:scaffold100729_cov37-Tisochrysis_lutea.AAC.1
MPRVAAPRSLLLSSLGIIRPGARPCAQVRSIPRPDPQRTVHRSSGPPHHPSPERDVAGSARRGEAVQECPRRDCGEQSIPRSGEGTRVYEEPSRLAGTPLSSSEPACIQSIAKACTALRRAGSTGRRGSAGMSRAGRRRTPRQTPRPRARPASARATPPHTGRGPRAPPRRSHPQTSGSHLTFSLKLQSYSRVELTRTLGVLSSRQAWSKAKQAAATYLLWETRQPTEPTEIDGDMYGYMDVDMEMAKGKGKHELAIAS